MAKGGDLWDDSALVDAFDHAMSTYKMHKKKKQVSGPDDGEVITVLDNINTETRNGNGDALSMPTANGLTTVEECNDLSLVEEDPAPEASADGGTQDTTFECHSVADLDAYNQLLGQYYELEASRQKVLEQLSLYGDMSNQNYGASQGNPGLEMAGASSIPQDYVSACRVACPMDIYCCCCTYVCPTSAEPCRLSSCSVGSGTGIQHHGNAVIDNSGITRTAMEAIGRAMSSLKVNAPASEDKDGEGEAFSGGTDITDVMNAWYSAGFYTGKYLAEQSGREKSRV
ncbi:hypothetical protein MLD38_018309 [Melastoma candidum]|uniref:Uncharacterized protein n=1 Tax=Melastoma candidum TaxID=119954 RepID=A0ACB9QTD7_9MYRT|nr:hypothetical protein MLD38_018309 [Melastoma candidum]